MKASIVFHEHQNPNFRAKIPLNLFGFPFRSAIEFAETDNLSFTFCTFFRTGPSFNLSYRPNDSLNPFTLAVKAGIGLLGSPIHAPMTFKAEFNLIPGNDSPRFFLRFKPQLGDFTLRRSVQSHIASADFPNRNSISRLDVDSTDLSKGKAVNGGESSRLAEFDLGLGSAIFDCSQVLKRVDDVFSRVEINARSMFQVRDRAAVKLRWCMKFPTSVKKEDYTAWFPFSEMPYLALDKIKIEGAAANDGEQESDEAAGAREFSCLKKQLDDLWTESRWLKKNLEQIRSEIGDQKAAPSPPPPPVESLKNISLKKQ